MMASQRTNVIIISCAHVPPSRAKQRLLVHEKDRRNGRKCHSCHDSVGIYYQVILYKHGRVDTPTGAQLHESHQPPPIPPHIHTTTPITLRPSQRNLRSLRVLRHRNTPITHMRATPCSAQTVQCVHTGLERGGRLHEYPR